MLPISDFAATYVLKLCIVNIRTTQLKVIPGKANTKIILSK